MENEEILFYGGCGVENCADCLPLYDLDNNEIPGTIDPGNAISYIEGLHR